MGIIVVRMADSGIAWVRMTMRSALIVCMGVVAI